MVLYANNAANDCVPPPKGNGPPSAAAVQAPASSPSSVCFSSASRSHHSGSSRRTTQPRKRAPYAPSTWNFKGIPDNELTEALARGAAPEAVNFLSNRGKDARLFTIQNLGWIRTAKNVFNLWEANAQSDIIIHDSKEFWRAQYDMKEHDMIDVLEHALGRAAEKHMQPMQPGDVTATFADISRLQALTGYSPQVTIDEGLPRFVDWHRGHYGW